MHWNDGRRWLWCPCTSTSIPAWKISIKLIYWLKRNIFTMDEGKVVAPNFQISVEVAHLFLSLDSFLCRINEINQLMKTDRLFLDVCNAELWFSVQFYLYRFKFPLKHIMYIYFSIGVIATWNGPIMQNLNWYL